MSKMEDVRAQMVQAMKSGEKERKEALSMLLAALKAKFIDKREELTEEEENAVVLRELKQTKETLASAPADRADIREQCERRITVLQEFAPREMSEEEIRAQIQASLAALGIEQPTIRDKGRLMKELMPRVKGKADGALVNRLVTELLA
ncbi:GatB/YqeY domain-containing protein [Anaeromassilibacillus sp. SJQ-5]